MRFNFYKALLKILFAALCTFFNGAGRTGKRKIQGHFYLYSA